MNVSVDVKNILPEKQTRSRGPTWSWCECMKNIMEGSTK
jgi:hypothetical protein